MKTKSIYTEILLALSPKNSILDAFKWFGLSNKSKSIAVVVEKECLEQLKSYIKGDFEEQPGFESDKTQLEKVVTIN
jgi:tRNA threonylcarbamoyladenosine modification (KEOPS) complex Cgi121 subunit